MEEVEVHMCEVCPRSAQPGIDIWGIMIVSPAEVASAKGPGDHPEVPPSSPPG